MFRAILLALIPIISVVDAQIFCENDRLIDVVIHMENDRCLSIGFSVPAKSTVGSLILKASKALKQVKYPHDKYKQLLYKETLLFPEYTLDFYNIKSGAKLLFVKSKLAKSDLQPFSFIEQKLMNPYKALEYTENRTFLITEDLRLHKLSKKRSMMLARITIHSFEVQKRGDYVPIEKSIIPDALDKPSEVPLPKLW